MIHRTSPVIPCYDTESKTPKLRFPEFSGEWEEKKLGEIATNKSKKYNPEKETISYKCIELEHLTSENGQLLGYVDSLNSGSIKNKFNKNDVLFGKLRPYLKKYLLAPFDGVCSSEIWVLNGNEISNHLLYYIVQTEYFIGLANQSSGSKMPRADWNVVENATLYIPSKPEQQKIANFLAAIDTKIDQLTKKQTLLKQYKKGVMQKLFSQELRFKADDGSEFSEWEEKKLGEVAKFSKGKGISKNDIIENGTNECIRYGELYTRYGEVINRIYSRTNIDLKNLVLSEENDVIIPASGETQIDIATASCVLKSGIALGGDLNIIRTKNNGVFLSYYLNNMKKVEIANLAQGASVVHLYSKQLATLNLKFPTKPEQEKIANFLTAIDTKIDLATKQLEELKQFKKALLQQMFV
jgi:type I restriction enzyme S subunit